MRWYRPGVKQRSRKVVPVFLGIYLLLAIVAWDVPKARGVYLLFAGGFALAWLAIGRSSAARPATLVKPSGLARQPTRSLIERLCQETGWGLLGQEAGRYQVRSRDTDSPVAIEVCYGERQVNVLFQSWLPIRFSLERPPAGLFARVMLRGHTLNWSGWQMSIGGSCEACLYLSASVPRTALDAGLFQEVCTEIADELRDFHLELHDKFAYDLGGVAAEAMPREVVGGVPARRA
jgi:hypothetical protein